MKKFIPMVLALLLIAIIAATGVIAGDQNPNASAKATAQITDLYIDAQAATSVDDDFDWDANGVLLLTQTIKTANMKDLFIDVSLLSGLYTQTEVKSQGGNKDTSMAASGVVVLVRVDDVNVFPGPVVFNARFQQLSATLQGIIDENHIITAPEVIELIIATLSANSFSFIVTDLDAGMHTVKVFAKCVAAAANQKGSASAKAAIGLGSVTVEEVRMVKGENAIVDVQ